MEIIELTAQNFSGYGREIAKMHLGAYSKRHLTANFSVEKLEEYYRCLVEASELSVIAVEPAIPSGSSDAARVLGCIVAGPAVSRGVSRFLRNHRLYVFSVMLKHPMFLFQKLHSTLMSRLRKITPSEAKFRLLSIAVRSDTQSRGVGRAMLDFFEQSLSMRGVRYYGLSVRGENDRAISFYEKNGFVLEKEFSGSKYFKKRLGNS